MANNEFPIHAHVETASQDCDGRYTSGHLMVQTMEEKASEFGDIEFHNRVVSEAVNTYSLLEKGTLTVNRMEDGDVRLSWSEATDEGFRQKEITICTDDCDLGDTPWSRDHSAEAAGY